jgi:hypothetical protein
MKPRKAPMMRHIASVFLAAGLLASVAFTPAAADPLRPAFDGESYLVPDVADDANFTNEQSLDDITGEVVPETSTSPASLAEADILGARINGLYEELVADDGTVSYTHVGLEFRTKLAAEPTDDTAPLLHRFNVTLGGCTLLVQSYSGINSRTDPSVRYSTGCVDDGGTVPTVSEITGPWLRHSWDAQMSELVIAIDTSTTTDIIKAGTKVGDYIKVDGVYSQSDSQAVLLPVWDAADGGQYFQVGEDMSSVPVTVASTPTE